MERRARQEGDWASFRLESLLAGLQQDFTTVVTLGDRFYEQQQGLVIGSAWGGAGCAVWSAARERDWNNKTAWALFHVQDVLRSRRLCYGTSTLFLLDCAADGYGSQSPAHIACMTQVGLARWVDDRLQWCAAPTFQAAWVLQWTTTMMYSLPWAAVLILLRGMTSVAASTGVLISEVQEYDAAWLKIMLQVRAFLGGGLAQTEEATEDFVGIQMALNGDAVRKLPRGPFVPIKGERLRLRMLLKEKDLVEWADRHADYWGRRCWSARRAGGHDKHKTMGLALQPPGSRTHPYVQRNQDPRPVRAAMGALSAHILRAIQILLWNLDNKVDDAQEEAKADTTRLQERPGRDDHELQVWTWTMAPLLVQFLMAAEVGLTRYAVAGLVDKTCDLFAASANMVQCRRWCGMLIQMIVEEGWWNCQRQLSE